jgi:hypothetical protein
LAKLPFGVDESSRLKDFTALVVSIVKNGPENSSASKQNAGTGMS